MGFLLIYGWILKITFKEIQISVKSEIEN